MIKQLLLIFIIIFSLHTFSQESKKGILKVKKIGFLYNNTDQNNFIFDDPDYLYNGKTYKIQAFYNLGSWKSFNFELIAQPQYQSIEHQLVNEQFVLPSEGNYLEKRIEFTSAKNINFYAFEVAFVMKRELFKSLDVLITAGLGLGAIDTRTERLAKGFTFLENFSAGFAYKATKKTALYLGSNVGHISNFDTQKPNNGYSFLGFEVGFAYLLK